MTDDRVQRFKLAFLRTLRSPTTVAALVLLAISGLLLERAAFNWSRVLWANETTLARSPLPFGHILGAVHSDPKLALRWTIVVGTAGVATLCERLPRAFREGIRIVSVLQPSGLAAVDCRASERERRMAHQDSSISLSVSDMLALQGEQFVLVDRDNQVVYGALTPAHIERLPGIVKLFDSAP